MCEACRHLLLWRRIALRSRHSRIQAGLLQPRIHAACILAKNEPLADQMIDRARELAAIHLERGITFLHGWTRIARGHAFGGSCFEGDVLPRGLASVVCLFGGRFSQVDVPRPFGRGTSLSGPWGLR